MSGFGSQILSQGIPSAMIDASGRLRVSEPYNLGSYLVEEGDSKPLLLQTVGTGGAVVNSNNIAMTATAGQYSIVYTKQHHPYFEGNSHKVEATSIDFGAQSGFEKSIEYMDSSTLVPYNSNLDGFRLIKDINDNYHMEFYNNGTLVKRLSRNTPGEWLDPLNGTGQSKLNINWGNFNVFSFDFLYLGGTAVACHVMHNRQWVLFCVYYHAGTYGGTIMDNPNHRIRYVLRASGGAVGTGLFTYVCAKVGSEGTVNRNFQQVVVNDRGALINFNNVNITYVVFSVKKKATRLNTLAWLDDIQTFLTSNDNGVFTLLLNPTLSAGSLSYSDLANTPIQQAIGNGTQIIAVGSGVPVNFNSTIQTTPLGDQNNFDNILSRLASTIDGTADELMLCFTPRTPTVTITASALIKFK